MRNQTFKPRLEVLEARITPADLLGQVQSLLGQQVTALTQQVQQTLGSQNLTDLGNALSELQRLYGKGRSP